jgi:hypothetical protein
MSIPAKVAKCLQTLESTIDQSDAGKNLKERTLSSDVYLNSNLQAMSLLDNRLHGDSQQFPQHEVTLNIKEEQQIQKELLLVIEDISIVLRENEDVDSSDHSIGKSMDIRANRLRSLRSSAFRLALQTCRATGRGILSSDGMERSSVWKMVSMVS